MSDEEPLIIEFSSFRSIIIWFLAIMGIVIILVGTYFSLKIGDSLRVLSFSSTDIQLMQIFLFLSMLAIGLTMICVAWLLDWTVNR
jgi:hypothetical protein